MKNLWTLTIGKKIWVSFALVLTCLLTLALNAKTALENSNKSFVEFEKSASDEISGLRAIAEIHQMRREVLSFAMGDATAQERIAILNNSLRRAVAAKVAGEEDPEHAKRLQGVVATLEAYTRSIPNLHDLAPQERLAQVNGEMRTQALQIIGDLEMMLSEEQKERHAMKAAAYALNGAVLDRMWWISGLALVITSLMAFLLQFSISRPLHRLTSHVLKLTTGDDDFEIAPTRRKDEIGELQRASIVLKNEVSEAFKLRQMVEDMPLALMLADPRNDFRISYLNKASGELLSSLQAHLSVDVSQMKGASVDIFHRNPEHVRGILSSPDRLPWNARVRIGDDTLDLRISAIRDRKGNYIGPMLCWRTVTRMQDLTQHFERRTADVVRGVAAAAVEMQASARALSATAANTTSRANAVAAATEETTVNVQTVAGTSEQLSASISEITRQVSAYNAMSESAIGDIRRMDSQAKELDQAAASIGEVVVLITAIASQTNLLALNATIESARAGEAGKGFAVVASEVKQLAAQTARATDAISEKVVEIQGATRASVASIEGIAKAVAEMNDISRMIGSAMTQQQAATQEIARNVQEAAAGTREVSNNIQNVTVGASDTGTAAEQLLAAAAELASQAELLRGEVEGYLAEVRAA